MRSEHRVNGDRDDLQAVGGHPVVLRDQVAAEPTRSQHNVGVARRVASTDAEPVAHDAPVRRVEVLGMELEGEVIDGHDRWAARTERDGVERAMEDVRVCVRPASG
jgi:hypothetical protein